MSRRTLIFLFSLFPLMLGVQAQSPQPAGSGAMAWINADQLIMNCDEGKRDFGELQNYVEQKTKQGEALNKEVGALRQKIDIQAGKLTDEARTDLEDQYEAKNSEMQRLQQDAQNQIEKRRTRIAGRVLRKAQPVIEKIARAKALKCVFYLNQVAWVDPDVVITDEVLKAYNAAYPIAPAPKK